MGNRVVIPSALRDKVLKDLHQSHPGMSKMKALARSYFWWPEMDKNIENVVKSCQKCQINQAMPHQAPVHNWKNTRTSWVRVHIDYAGPYLGKMFLIIVDSYSKWIDVFPTSSATSKSTIEKLRIRFANHGLPQVCVSDNGSNFVSNEFKCFMELNGIRHITSATYHPRTNGCAEHAVRTFKNNMEKLNCQESIQTAVS